MSECISLSQLNYFLTFSRRFPTSLPFVILDTIEKGYVAGFAVLQLFTTLFPLWAGKSSEFLPLMLTSIYCAIGLVWAFIRLSVLYLRQSEGVMWT